MTPLSILDTALELAAAGYSVIPIRPDGSKSPAVAWKPYISQAPTPDQLHAWFDDGRHDLAVIQGRVSGGAELTELEGRAAHHVGDLRALAHHSGLGDLWNRIMGGWTELSPSGGFHFHYRVTGHDVPGNTRLAVGPKHEVLAETRGDGGYVIAAPSRHHPTGQPWRRIQGGPATAASITVDERDAFHTLLRTLDHAPSPAPTPAAPQALRTPRNDGSLTPGDDFEAKTDWADILTPHGWALAAANSHTRYWRRPGKPAGISATTGQATDRDRLYVFSTSTPFEPNRPYTKFGAHAVLEHHGDHSAAAKDLAARGYGTSTRHPQADRSDFTDFLPSGTTPRVAAATATHRAPAASGDVYTETDDGNALRLIDIHHQHIRYVPQRGQWLRWDGHRWAWDDTGHIQELARHIARGLPPELTKLRAASLSRRGIEAMVALARTDPRVAINLNQLDAHPYHLNTPTGIIDLRTGTLTSSDPAAMHTRSTLVGPDLDSPPSRWLDFLADTFAGDPDLTCYIQRLLGLSLVGVVLEQLLPFAYGAGANGKTTLAGVVQRVVGIGDSGYSISVPSDMLIATYQQGHPTEIARLAGARLVITSEIEDGQRFAEAKIKQLTGKDTISGRFMHKDWFSFTPTHTLWLLANAQPTVRAGGPAFWRRLRLLPFEHTVPTERRVADLEDRLVDKEAAQILGWLIAGARDYFAHGLTEPASVRAATAAYEGDQDTVGRFVNEYCKLGDPNQQFMSVRISDFRQQYETWCRTEGEQPVSAKALTSALKSRYAVLTTRNMSSRSYAGIRLRDLDLETPDTTKPVMGTVMQPVMDEPRTEPPVDNGGFSTGEGEES